MLPDELPKNETAMYHHINTHDATHGPQKYYIAYLQSPKETAPAAPALALAAPAFAAPAAPIAAAPADPPALAAPAASHHLAPDPSDSDDDAKNTPAIVCWQLQTVVR